MRYLLDVNVLLALGHTGHVHHAKAASWYGSIVSSATGLHTCAITELGFVRVATQLGLQVDISSARSALDALKASSKVRFELVPDDLGAAHLPSFVKTPAAVTDGHLLELAKKNSMKLVTLDRGVPGALYIG
jgi:toxin-antitoxin system PIN domain toxin